MDTKELQDVLKNEKEINFTTLSDVTFLEYLNERVHDSLAKIIEQTTLQRNYAYQIFNGTRLPGRDKLLQIGLAMQLSLDEINHLLSLSNNGNLYPKVKRDAIVIYAIHHHLSVIDTNLLLQENKQEILR